MKNIIIDNSLSESCFVPIFSGEEKCSPAHTFGPYIRDYFIIHFCLSGKGVLTDKYGEHKIKAGELFIIREGETTTYRADEREPWHYLWIAAVGKRSDELEMCPSVIKCGIEFFSRIKEVIDRNEARPEIYCAFLYEILYRISCFEQKDKPDKLSSVKRYIKYNYMLDINAQSVSHQFGFERSYLYRMFKKRYGMGVKEYIIKIRMEKASSLLQEGYSVKETSFLVGYSDEFAFSKAFKNYFGSTPSSFRMPSLGNVHK